jgi:hypothetical protein
MLLICHNSQPIPTRMYWVLSISFSPPLLWMTFQQHNIPQKCWYISGSLYYVTVQTSIIKTQNVIWISNMTLNMCLHSLAVRVHLYEQWKGYKRPLQQRIRYKRPLQQRILHLWVSVLILSVPSITVENCALLGYYAASSVNSLPAFQDNLSKVKLPRVGPWISTGLRRHLAQCILALHMVFLPCNSTGLWHSPSYCLVLEYMFINIIPPSLPPTVLMWVCSCVSLSHRLEFLLSRSVSVQLHWLPCSPPFNPLHQSNWLTPY